MEYNPINFHGRFPFLGKSDAHELSHGPKHADNTIVVSTPPKNKPAVIFPVASGANPEDQYLCQRFVIFERDDKGYGLTVSGDNPVFVQSVKEDGPAYLAGVQKGDRIIKVNEKLVTQCNHTEVVRLIKANAFVALTLLGKSPTKLPTAQSVDTNGRGAGSKPPTAMPAAPTSMSATITGPQPVDPSQQQSFSDNRLQTMNTMREKEMQNIFQLTKEFQVNPSEKLQVDLDAALKRVKQLQEQIFVLSFRRNQAAAAGATGQVSPTARISDRPLPPLPVDVAMAQPGRVSRRNSGTSNHSRQLSTPEPLHIAEALSVLQPSDGLPYNRSLSDLLSPNPNNVTVGSLPPSGVVRRPPPPELRTRTFSVGEKGDGDPTPYKRIANGPSDRKSHLGTFPGLSVAPRRTQADILAMEDTSQAAIDANQRPFMHYLTLQRHLPHLSVFIQYLISSSDPSSLFFHFLSEHYSKGNSKEMQRWAFEIHSTFLVPGAPLEIECVKKSPALVNHVDEILDKVEKAEESQLRDLFTTIRNRALDSIKIQLAEFQQKKVLGLGTMFGPSEADLDEADKSAEKTKDVVGEVLGKTLESIGTASLEEPESRSDRQAAIGCALASFLKLTSAKLKEKDGLTLVDKWPLFLQKDKNKFKLKDKTKKTLSVASHQFSQVTCTSVVSCNHCKEILWGVAPQGYQCAFCDYIAHRGCAKKVEEICVGKKANRAGFPSAVEDFFGLRKKSNQNPVAIANAKKLHEDKEDVRPGDRSADRPDSSLGHRLAEGKSPDRSDFTRESSPSVSRSASLRDKRKVPAENRKKSDPSKLDREENDSANEKLTRTSESSSTASSAPSLRSSESPITNSESADVVPDGDSDFEANPDYMPSWQSYLPNPEIFEKLDSRNRKRQDVIEELFNTERTHVRNLKVLRMVFYGPMTRDNLLPPELASQVFANLDEMIEMHSQLNKGMREMRKSKSLIGKVGDLLLSRFDGEPGYRFKMAAAAFCRNQSSGLEALKLRQKKDQKLAAFLAEAESNPLCRRLHLKDLLPAGMQRLTKYPLLLSSLLKYTSTEQDEDKEYEKIFLALNSSKEILDFVNQAVKESGNQNRLRDLQDKIDMAPYRKTQMKLGLEYKPLDLSDFRLYSDGDLTWRYNKQKTVDLRVILLNKYLLLVTRQEDKLILKYHTNPQGSAGGDKRTSSHNWTPILSLEQLTVKDVQNDPRAFFLYWQGPTGAHMYELSATTVNEQKLWVKEIRSAIEGLSGCMDIMSAFPQTATVSVTSSSSTSVEADSPDSEPTGDVEEEEEGEEKEKEKVGQKEKRFLENYRESKRRKSMVVLTSPSAVVVTQAEIMNAELILTPFEQLRRRDKQLEEALLDKKRLVSSILGISEENSMSRETSPTKEDASETKSLVFQAMQQCNQLTELVTDVWATGDNIIDMSQQMQPESQSSEPATDGRRSSSAQTRTSVPMLDVYQLEEISVTLNRQLAALMRVVCMREEETERLRKELKHAKEQVTVLRSETRSPSPSFSLARPINLGFSHASSNFLSPSNSSMETSVPEEKNGEKNGS